MNAPRPVAPGRVLVHCSAAFGVPVADILGASKVRPVVEARDACALLLRRLTHRSWPEIARDTARTSHSTMLAAYGRALTRMEGDEFARRVGEAARGVEEERSGRVAKWRSEQGG